MTARLAYFCSTIGRKQLVAVGGLGLCLFVLTHALGNFLMFVGPEAYNKYGHALVSNPLIYVAEAGLVAIFLMHAIIGITLAIKNRNSRPQKYAKAASGEKKTSLTSKTLAWQGIIILVFVVYHLITFKFGPHYTATYDGQEIRDLYRLLVEVFQSPAYVIGYVFAVLVLGFHLAHGLGSALQTFGLNHQKYNRTVNIISIVYGLVIALGFASQPIYIFFYH